MNKKYLAVLFVAGIILFLTACTTQEKAHSRETTLQGMIRIHGNEPHTWVGIETTDGKLYAVAPPEKAAELRSMQGRLLEFTVILQSGALFGAEGTANVLSWKQVR